MAALLTRLQPHQHERAGPGARNPNTVNTAIPGGDCPEEVAKAIRNRHKKREGRRQWVREAMEKAGRAQMQSAIETDGLALYLRT